MREKRVLCQAAQAFAGQTLFWYDGSYMETTPLSKTRIINTARMVFQKFPTIRFAYLFGSHARGKIGPLSDIDLALYFDPPVSENKREKITGEVGDEIARSLQLRGDYPVQIQILNEIQQTQRALEHDIVYNGILIYSSDEAARAHYEAGAIHRWIEWLPRQERFNEATLNSLQKPIEPYRVYA